ncbi:DUF4365 domain-containing protein [Bradyrhizobium sp. CCBAU 11357]|uniref:DUF4365 domain-containing protein n=1 Tax=Bradyrhizobium sp. CCBAU 11357 TaxID=1630808 RepID=UPI003FA43196|nr:hypothetical protein [Bradyrhizobium sp. CCBAU 11357]
MLNRVVVSGKHYAKRDVGIDAQVEICRDGLVTSRLLSVQIKAGDSYFTEPTADGWTYRDSKHLDYYLAHSLPVLVYPKSKEAWWQHVSETTVRRTNRGWTLCVPRHHPLGEQARVPLEEIAQVVPAEERVKIGAVKPLRPGVADFASIYDVLHSARRELFFVSPYISPEFVAILDFLSTRVPIRGIVAETPISLDAASILAGRSQLALRCLARQSRMLHEKLIIVDKKVVWISSANLTWRGIMRALEVLHASTDGKTVRNGLRHFEDIWDRSVPLSTIVQERS